MFIYLLQNTYIIARKIHHRLSDAVATFHSRRSKNPPSIRPDPRPRVQRPVSKTLDSLRWDVCFHLLCSPDFFFFESPISFSPCKTLFLESGTVLMQKSKIGFLKNYFKTTRHLPIVELGCCLTDGRMM